MRYWDQSSWQIRLLKELLIERRLGIIGGRLALVVFTAFWRAYNFCTESRISSRPRLDDWSQIHERAISGSPGAVWKLCAEGHGIVRMNWWRGVKESSSAAESGSSSLLPLAALILLAALCLWAYAHYGSSPTGGVEVAAIGAGSAWEVRTTGNAANGGGFIRGASGTDWSQQDSPQYAVTDAVTNGTTTITSATANFGTDVVGNVLYIAGGTAGITAGWYEIKTRTNATTITVDRSTGLTAGTGATLNIGGALSSIGAVGAAWVSGTPSAAAPYLNVWIKSGTYTTTTTTTMVDGGLWTSGLAGITMRGYQTTRGDDAAAPLIEASGISTFTLFAGTGSDCNYVNIQVDCGLLTSSRGFTLNSRQAAWNCAAGFCKNSGFAGTSTSACFFCYASICSTAGAGFNQHNLAYGCEATANSSIPGFLVNGAQTAVFCLSYEQGGSAADGFSFVSSANAGAVVNCTSYSNTGDGVGNTGAITACRVVNSILEDNGGWGVNMTGSPLGCAVLNCAFYNNTSGDINSPTNMARVDGKITGTATFMARAGSGDFTVTSTQVMGLGYGTFLSGTTTSYPDVGAVQHHWKPFVHPGMNGGMRG